MASEMSEERLRSLEEVSDMVECSPTLAITAIHECVAEIRRLRSAPAQPEQGDVERARAAAEQAAHQLYEMGHHWKGVDHNLYIGQVTDVVEKWISGYSASENSHLRSEMGQLNEMHAEQAIRTGGELSKISKERDDARRELAEQRWIPIETYSEPGKPPFDGEPVLIVTNHTWCNRVHRAKWTDAIHGDGIFGWAVEDCKFGPYPLRGYTVVTHWRPLPAPPDALGEPTPPEE